MKHHIAAMLIGLLDIVVCKFFEFWYFLSFGGLNRVGVSCISTEVWNQDGIIAHFRSFQFQYFAQVFCADCWNCLIDN